MGRRRRPFIRPTPFRDSRLIIIATEGESTEKIYFETLGTKEYYCYDQEIINQFNITTLVYFTVSRYLIR